VDVNGDVNASNDTAEDVTRVLQAGIDLEITKVHDLNDGLFRGKRATYILKVANVGTAQAIDTIRVVDQLPADVSYVSAAGGLFWVCSHSAGEVRCHSNRNLLPGASAPDIRIRVTVDADAPDEIINTASVDVNGDSNGANDTAEHAGTVSGFAADYLLTKTHSGDFVVGEPGFYRLNVKNVGFATAGNQVSILDQLPAGLAYDSASGDGWSCGALAQDVTCTHSGPVEAGDSLPTLTLEVDVGAAALGSVTNVAGVSSADDGNTANDVASDPTNVRNPQPDLIISKAHQGNFMPGQNGTYTIVVSNASQERADGPTTVTDTLPAGLGFVSASGTGWSCGALAQDVTCTNADTIEGSTSAAPITLVVAASAGLAGQTVTNTASVGNASDVNTANNSASDPTVVANIQAPTELETHELLVEVKVGRVRLIQGPVADLTSNGQPVPGKTITFRTKTGKLLCNAQTNAEGTARCAPTLLWLTQAIRAGSFRYTASFAGDLNYEPATADGEIVNVLGGPEPGS
jgi:uncharacterized repeat protein (TIGR01451 family)